MKINSPNVGRGDVGEAPSLRSRAGRPSGSLTTVLRGGRWGLHHFAYLRAVEEGVDARFAWERYLAFQGEAGASRAGALLDRLCSDIVAVLDRWPARREAVLASIETLRSAPAVAARAPLTLDDFVAERGIDPDFYTEAELLDLYRQERSPLLDVKLPATAVEPPAGTTRLSALRALEPLVAKAPSPKDKVEVWVAPRMSGLLGDVTVGQLSSAIMNLGPGWSRPIRGLGRVQALRLATWLDSTFRSGHVAALSVSRPPGRPQSTSQRPALAYLARRFGAVSSEALDDDAAWVEGWLAGRGSAIRQEVERFFLWLHCVQHSTRFQLRADTVTAYLDWATSLANEDGAWVRSTTFEHANPKWRPFRTALGPRASYNAAKVLHRFVGAVKQSAGPSGD